MEIRVLRYFLTVVREESITKASEVFTYHAADTFTSACTDGGRYWCKAV